MKFLFLSAGAHLALDPYAQKSSGGAELQVGLLARELVKRAYPVTLLVSDQDQKDDFYYEGIKIRVVRKFDSGALWETCLAVPSVLRALLIEKPDVVVVYGWTAWLYFVAQVRIFLPYRLVFVCALDSEIEGNFSYTNSLKRWLFQRGMKLSNVRFGITEHQQKLFHAQGMTCLLTRLLIQKASSHSLINNDKPIDLLWVARCHEVKQPLLFLELARRCGPYRLQMICSKQDEKLWNRVKEEVQDCKNIEFLESVPYREVQSYFDRAKIFVNTSIEEGVPNTFIHAGLGHTAIASLRVNPDGMFDHFHAGCYALNDKEKFFTSIKQLLSNSSLLSLAQEESAHFVRAWHDNEKNLQAFIEGVLG